MIEPTQKRGAVALTTNTPSNDLKAIATFSYPETQSHIKPLESRVRGFAGQGRLKRLSVTYRAANGLEWRYKGKRARVVAMLAETDSVTQWDTLPWHTRLGGTIHALRRDGLAIDTELVGEYRHARYRLRTPGTVIIHRDNTGAEQ
jgi:hypothetical protein